MALRQILTEPNEILRKKSLPVEAVNKDLQKLMDDMLETMYAAPGIGLAAIQIGVPKRIIVMDIGFRDKSDDINNYKEEGKKNPMYFVNPEKINKSKLRVGRGIGSGKGKTSGRGVKGQKSRSGVSIKSFEGGQMPLYRRLPKRGFNSISKENIAILNLNKIQSHIDDKSLKSSETINSTLLKKLRLINKNSVKLKILGSGEIKSKINIEADLASKSAIEKLEKMGGSIQLKK